MTSHEHAQRLFKIDKEDLMPFGYDPETTDDGESKKENSTHGQYLENVMQQHHDQLSEFVRMYKIDSWKENMFIIFGSSNLAAAVFIPLERPLPLRGLEWSFMD
jgi:hypothetical protein